MQANQRGLSDPNQLITQLKRIQKLMAVMSVHTLNDIPALAGQLSKMVPLFDRAIKEAMQAANVNSAVRQPIQMGAANSSPQPGAQVPTAAPSAMPMT